MTGDRAQGHVQPPLRPIGPAFHPGVLALVHLLLPVLLRFRIFPWLPAGIRTIEVRGADQLVRSFHRFASGETRLLLAVRHCEVDDPLLGLHLLSRVLPRQAARSGVRLPKPLHVQFLFDRGMPLWGGPALGWVLSRLGGVSIRRGRRVDRSAMRRARELLLDGRFPFAVAPEGATNGHGERIGPLQPGIVQLGLWCVEDLRRSNRTEEVIILPIGLRYTYCRTEWWRLERLMARLEAQIGVPRSVGPTPEPAETSDPVGRLYSRLVRLGNALLERLEEYYGPAGSRENATEICRDQRSMGSIQMLVERALSKAETQLGIEAKGTAVDRCRRVEEGVWQVVHPDHLPPRRHLSPLHRSLADRAAREASLAEIHMRLAECFVAVSGSYVAEHPSFERFMETTLLIHDAVSRLLVRGLPSRPRIGARRGLITVGAPLSLTERCPRVQGDRAGGIEREVARRLIRDTCEEIRLRFEAMIQTSAPSSCSPPLPTRCPSW